MFEYGSIAMMLPYPGFNRRDNYTFLSEDQDWDYALNPNRPALQQPKLWICYQNSNLGVLCLRQRLARTGYTNFPDITSYTDEQKRIAVDMVDECGGSVTRA